VGPSSFSTPSTFHDEVIFADAGRIRERLVNAANVDSNFDVTQMDVLVVRAVSVTAAHIYSLQNTGASVGSRIEVNNFSSFTQTIHDSGGVLIGTVPLPGSLGGRGIPGVLKFRYEDDGIIGARWVLQP
jgi:hypothetical protein